MSSASKTNTPIPKIELLPEHVIDQIKAGEVIERPASLLKEVIENSLDARSRRIDIELKNNGLDLIGIEDDGEGIEYSQLPFAFCRHATSKIKKFDDIYALTSYGFRGEALASAAGIARIHCTSSPLPPYKGGKYVIHGGREMEHSPCSSTKHGTSLFIRDLFYNTPARLKFVKSKTAEKNAIAKVLYSFIINNPSVTFTVCQDGGEKQFFPAVEDDQKKKRVGRAFYGERKTGDVLHGEGDYGEYHMEIFVSPETTRSAASRRQFLFINERAVEDKALHYTVTKGMPSLWRDGYSGHYCIFVRIPPDEIDVNAHPNKTTVRLFRTDVVISLAKSIVAKIDRTSDRPTPVETRSTEEPAAAAPPRASFPAPVESRPAETPRFDFNPPPKSAPPRQADVPRRPEAPRFDFRPSIERARPSEPPPPEKSPPQEERQVNIHPDVSLVAIGGHYHLVNRQTLLGEIVDGFLHSAPEEEFRSLPLLVGEPIPFDQKLGGKIDYLKSLGFDIDFPDKESLAVKGFPAALSGTPFLELIRSFLAAKDDDIDFKASLIARARNIAFDETALSRYLGDKKASGLKSVKPVDDDLVRTIFP